MAARQAWDRLDDESAKAYEAFAVYRDLGVNRTTLAVSQKVSKGIALIQRWSAAHDWVARVTAYDDYIDAQARIKLDRDAIKRKAQMLQRHADIGRSLQGFGLQHVQANKKAGPIKSADAITAIKTGVELERKSEGLPEYLMQIMETPDDELTRQYNELLASIGGNRSGNEAQGDASTGQDTAESQDPSGQ